MVDIILNGVTIEFDVVESMMDHVIRQGLASIMEHADEQEFVEAYMQVHRAKYGEAFLLS